jgi:hypothetical protein
MGGWRSWWRCRRLWPLRNEPPAGSMRLPVVVMMMVVMVMTAVMAAAMMAAVAGEGA